jgi:O-acetyl-ADP-ribose deacetylase (regulator of RNase III)
MISGKIAVIGGDIIQQPVEAIVNAANTSLA